MTVTTEPVLSVSARSRANHKVWLHKTIIRFIERYQEQYHCSPSWSEVAEAAGFATKSGITRHLKEMADLGLISYHPGKYRSLAVLQQVQPAKRK